jgi:hypothetical protein
MRISFRGIYFPQMNKAAWVKLLLQNRRTVMGLSKEAIGAWRASRKNKKPVEGERAPAMNEQKAA